MLDMMFADGRIEDLWLPFFCVSTNLTRTEVEGPPRRADPPRAVGEHHDPGHHAAGGRTATATCWSTAACSTTCRPTSCAASRRGRSSPPTSRPPSTCAPTRAGRTRRPPGSTCATACAAPASPAPSPTSCSLIMRAALLASDVYAKQAKREVELYLDLPMDPFDMFDMERLDDIVEFGYRFALPRRSPRRPALTPAAAPPPAPEVVARAHHPAVGAGVGDEEDVPFRGGRAGGGSGRGRRRSRRSGPTTWAVSVAGSSSRVRLTIGW